MHRGLLALIGAGILGFASPASAAVEITGVDSPGQVQVHMDGGSQTGLNIAAEADGLAVTLKSTTTLHAQGGGVSKAQGADGDGRFQDLSIFFDTYTGGFESISFSLFAQEAGNKTPFNVGVTLYYLDGVGSDAGILTLDKNLTKWNLISDQGDIYSKIVFSSPVGIDDIRQISLNPGPISAIPEPQSWALMIVGFGLLGGALRRRRTAARFA